jgi:hypothetical protein
MGHDGRFRLLDKRKSKLSGAILALPEGLVLCRRLPGFNLGHSICNWSPGDAQALA